VAELDTLIARLPVLSAVSTSKNLYVLNNPGSANCNIQMAIQKNWTPDKAVTSSSFYMPTATANSGTTVELDVCLTNPLPVIAFELDAVFPAGFELDTVRSCLNATRKGNHLLSIARTGTDQYKFMAYSLSTGDCIKGNSGVVLQLFGKAPDSVKVHGVQLKQAVLVDTTTSMCTVTVTNGTLNVVPASVNGDVNGDKSVDVTDIVLLVAYINGRNPAGFTASSADLDNNGSLNVADITRMVVLINARNVGLRSALAVPTRSMVLYDPLQEKAGNFLYIRPGSSNSLSIELCLDNAEPVQACQVDLSLPEGLTIQTNAVGTKTDRQNGHLVQVSAVGTGRYRLLAYALRPDAAFRGDSGVLAVLPLQLSESLPAAPYPVCLDAPVLTGMNRTTLTSQGFDLYLPVGTEPTKGLLKAGTDSHNGLWVQGLGLTDVTVWDLSGKRLDHQALNGSTEYRKTLPRGVYLVRARSTSETLLQERIQVR
jgi:hypothetical protein